MQTTKSQKTGATRLTEAKSKSQLPWFYIGLVGLVAIYLALAYLFPPGADSMWRLHIARGILDGKSLYYDLIEVNPPLWFWGAIPAAFMGGYPAIVGINLAASLVALWLFYQILSLCLPKGGVQAAVFALACGVFLFNVAEIGQREQAFLVASALWCALANTRLEGRRVAIPLTILVTAFAAYGFALKHYFVLVPLAIEAVLIWKLKRQWRPMRLETLLLALCAGLYGVAVIVLAPDFLGPILDLVQTTYFGFGMNSVGVVDRKIRTILACNILLIPLLSWRLTRDARPIIALFMVTIIMAFIAVMLQQKGWRYHLIGAHGLSLIVMVLMWQHWFAAKGAGFLSRFLPLACFAIIYSTFIWPTVTLFKTKGEALDPTLARLVAAEPRKHHIAILSSAPDRAFYVLARAARPHWTRHYSMWMMPGAITPQSDPTKEAKRLAVLDRVIGEFSADLTCNPPDLIIGEVGYVRTPDEHLLDAVAILRQNAAFATWLDRQYAQQADAELFPIWRLKGPKPAPINCLKPRSQ
jgi:hypothetical protein